MPRDDTTNSTPAPERAPGALHPWLSAEEPLRWLKGGIGLLSHLETSDDEIEPHEIDALTNLLSDCYDRIQECWDRAYAMLTAERGRGGAEPEPAAPAGDRE